MARRSLSLLRLSAASLILASAMLSATATAATSPVAEEPESCAPPDLIAAATVSGLAGDTLTREELDQLITEHIAKAGIAGISVAVINHGQLVYSHAAGLADRGTGQPVTDCTIFEGASITKPLFGHFVMTFVADGSLDLDRPLADYLPHPDLADDPRSRLLTARMVLSHRTGLPNWRDDEPDGRLHFRFTPGEGFSYSGEAYQYLALVLQKIAGVDGPGLETLFQQRLARPSGMMRTQIIPAQELLAHKGTPHDDNGQPAKPWVYDATFGAAFGVNSHAPDFARWLASLMQEKLPPAGLCEDLFALYLSPQPVAVPYNPANDLLQIGPAAIALGFFLNDLPGLGRLYHHDGNNPGFSSLVLMHPRSGWGFVAFANSNQATPSLLELAMMINPSLHSQ